MGIVVQRAAAREAMMNGDRSNAVSLTPRSGVVTRNLLLSMHS